MKDGISICILTYQVYFFLRLAIEKIREHTHLIPYEILVYDNGSTDGSVEWLKKQEDVRFFAGQGNSVRHGMALDCLVKAANYRICCTLCSDAHPVTPMWITPAFELYRSDYVLSGIDRGWGRILQHYVCPSYLFGWTDWLKNHSFLDKWPEWDTGEKLTQDAINEGRKIHLIPKNPAVSFEKFKSKDCDYAGLVWHVWWGGRRNIPGIVGNEVEVDYHDFMKDELRRKYALEY
jgi:glycosyltransferase involved in cell wall biosynthesis